MSSREVVIQIKVLSREILARSVYFSSPFHSVNAFCLCREFQLSVREILSIQSSLLLSSGNTLGNGYRDAEIVT